MEFKVWQQFARFHLIDTSSTSVPYNLAVCHIQVFRTKYHFQQIVPSKLYFHKSFILYLHKSLHSSIPFECRPISLLAGRFTDFLPCFFHKVLNVACLIKSSNLYRLPIFTFPTTMTSADFSRFVVTA